MNKIIIAFAALLTSGVWASAVQALDCSDPDSAAEAAFCARRAAKMPSFRPSMPHAAGRSASLKAQCDADDAEELRECLAGMKGAGMRHPASASVRPTAVAPQTKKLPAKIEAAPLAPVTPVAAAEKPAKVGGLDNSARCQKYFPNIGQTVSVPCPARALEATDKTPTCQRYFPSIDQTVLVPCGE